MKGTHQSSSSGVCNEAKTTKNDSEDESWEDKLVIDLDADNMDNKQTKGAASVTVDESTESDGSNNSAKEQQNLSNNKNNKTDNNSVGKTKGRRGQKKSNDNSKVENGTKQAGKAAAKVDKEKSAGAKPGRKRKDKQSPSPKLEANIAENSVDDPYKFDPTDEKVSATAIGKAGKTKQKGEPKASKDAQTEYDWRSVAVVTEPEGLGPCEPGTQVCLEGIVWQETNNGVLVVNVTWKGKTYMGTLLDATKHDWSPPSCDSPTGDFEGRTPKGRGKRSRVPLSDTFKDINERKLRKEMRKQSNQNQSRPKSPSSPPKPENGKRKGRSSECDMNEPPPKRGRAANNPNPPSPPARIECPEPNCNKKYKQMIGLRYHQRNAHPAGSPHTSSSNTTKTVDKTESVSSPEEPGKVKSSSTKDKKTSESSKNVKDNMVTEAASDLPVKSNTTSVITPTANSLTNPTTPQSNNVPVAAVTPQVVKPNNTNESTDQLSLNNNIPPLTSTATTRTLANSAPPRLISKPNVTNSTMAPISTITSPSVYNPGLKPIQPKPTILGEVTPNPSLHDLMDQKKLKRKRSASKEDLVNMYNGSEMQKPPMGSMHRFDTEHRGLLSTGGMINAGDPSHLLRSPSYSDISEDGEGKNNFLGRRELLTGRVNMAESSMHPQPPHLVATVSPQKNAPLTEKDSKRPVSRHTPSNSPAPVKTDEKANHKPIPNYLQHPAWPGAMNPELLHSHLPNFQSQLNRERGHQSVSPKGSAVRNSVSTSNRDMDSKASNDRLQILQESMGAKTNINRSDMPRDYTMSAYSNQSSDINMYRDIDQDHHKRDSMKNHSPAAKIPSSSSSSKAHDRVPHSTLPPSHPQGFLTPFNAFLSFNQLQGISNSQMLSRVGGSFLPPGIGFPTLGSMAAEHNKEHRGSPTPPFPSKPGHKIHELEAVQLTKSPRPPSSNDRMMCAKNQPITSQAALQSAAAAAVLLNSYGSGVLHPSIFPSSK